MCPPYATAAIPHGASKNFALASSYSILFNATQLPAGVVPVTRVRSDETKRAGGATSLGRQGGTDRRGERGPARRRAGRGAGPGATTRVLAAMQAIEGEVSRDEGFPVTPVDPVAARAVA